MRERSLKILEYDKIIAMLESRASSAPGKALCRALVPSDNKEEIITMQDIADTTRDAIANPFPSFLLARHIIERIR